MHQDGEEFVVSFNEVEVEPRESIISYPHRNLELVHAQCIFIFCLKDICVWNYTDCIAIGVLIAKFQATESAHELLLFLVVEYRDHRSSQPDYTTIISSLETNKV